MPTLCLNMIVKNERQIIERLLESVYSIIDTYLICDTGSDDDTPKIIKDFFDKKGIPGEVIFLPFKDFGYNRTYALEKARYKADYALLLDADMVLLVTPEFDKQSLTCDAYSIVQTNNNVSYYNARVVTLSKEVKCIGCTHEYYDIDSSSRLDGVFIQDIGDGGSKSNKLERDIKLLEDGLKDEPENARYHFYLGNTYFARERYSDSIIHYTKHLKISKWNEEKLQASLKLGHAYLKLDNEAMAISTWLEGFNICPNRSETVYELCKLYRDKGLHNLSFLFYKVGKGIPYPHNDILFIKDDVYTYLFDYELSIIGYYVKYQHMDCLNTKLMNVLPNNLYNNILNNYKFYVPTLTQVKKYLLPSIPENIRVCGTDYEMRPSTPCIFKDSEDTYAVNIRYVNYIIDRNTGKYVFLVNNDKICTVNKLIKLDQNFEITDSSSKYMIPDNDSLRYVGIEDIKVFNGMFFGTSLDPTTLKLSIKHGLYGDNLDGNIIKTKFNEPCEKNWVFFGDNNVVYKWFPLHIGKIVKECELDIRHVMQNTPIFFRYARGSTCGVQVGNEFWFVCHIVNTTGDNRRKYYHFFCVLDERYNIKKWSQPFTYGNEDIEYALGLVIEGDKIIISYSTWDRNPVIAIYDKNIIENELFWDNI